jgi:hypothetical protein
MSVTLFIWQLFCLNLRIINKPANNLLACDMRGTHYIILLVLLLSGLFYSCQKDSQDMVASTVLKADSSSTLTLSSPGNYLAVKGTLKITLPDTTYSFDASRDSVAFVSISSGGNQYFGITAINKAHTMSFGISSAGNASSNISSTVAGSQLLFSRVGKPNVEYTLPQSSAVQDAGKINLVTFKKDSVLATGTFSTVLTTDTTKIGSKLYKTKGTFSLQLK